MSAPRRRHRDRVALGAVSILLPDAANPRFAIVEDLSRKFGLGPLENYEAAKALRTHLREQGARHRRIEIDAEAQTTFIFAAKANDIVEAASAINALCKGRHRRPVANRDLRRALDLLQSAIVPKSVTISIGDVFIIPLRGTDLFACGQLVAQLAPEQATTCLFDIRFVRSRRVPTLESIVGSPVVAILHGTDSDLVRGRWPIIGSIKPKVAPFSGPCGHPFRAGGVSWDGLQLLAEAFFGARPWRSELDEYLMPGMRPKRALRRRSK